MLPTVNVTGGWEMVMEGRAREELERSVLPEYLRAQRWFGGKGRRIDAVRFLDWGHLPSADNSFFAVVLEVAFTEGMTDWYFLPLGRSSGENAARMLQGRQEWLIARLTGAEGESLLYDALADDDACLSLISAIGVEQEFATRQGRICAFPTTAFASLAGSGAANLAVERGPAKSSNSLIIYGRRLLLKLFRHLETGINPEFEIGRFLTENHCFPQVPLVAGSIEYHRNGCSAPITLAILQSFIVNQGDGWQHVLEHLSRFYQLVCNCDAVIVQRHPLLQLAETGPPPAAVMLIGDYLNSADTLGRRTAELHHALSTEQNDPAFAPEPFTSQDADALRFSIGAREEIALAALRDNLHQLPPDVSVTARQLLEKVKGERDGVSAPSRTLAALTQRGLPSFFKIRCHGDYHLGQVLLVGNDYVIIDFEGEPMRPLAERRAKQSPLKDVAGMVRSYHIAAYAGLFAFIQGHPEKFSHLRLWAELWYQWVSAAFLRAYRARTNGAAFVPADAAAYAELLDAFIVEKMFYELHYEVNNRPDWVRIPLHHVLTSLSP